MQDFVIDYPKWLFYESNEDENSVLLWHKVELTRNISDKKFPITYSNEQLSLQADLFSEFSKEFFPDFLEHDIHYVQPDILKLIYERMYINSYQLQHPNFSRIILDEKHNHGIRFNTSDHFELFSVGTGFFGEFDKDKLLTNLGFVSSNFPLAFNEDYGYLTSSLGKCGTGLTINLFMRFPGFMLLGKIGELRKIIDKYNLSLRPYNLGEKNFIGSGIFHICNSSTMGFDMPTLFDTLYLASNELYDLELNFREELIEKSIDSIEDKVMKTIGMLKYSSKIGGLELGTGIFSILLASELNILDISTPDVLKAYFQLGNAYISLLDETTPDKNADEIRSDIFQNLLRYI